MLFHKLVSEKWENVGTFNHRFCLLKRNGEIIVIDTFLDYIELKPTKIGSEKEIKNEPTSISKDWQEVSQEIH